MADYLPAPSFNLTYNTPLTDIGSGYAAGISQAGQGISSAITGLMGGVNPKTGEIQQGIFGQQRQADDTLAAMQQSGMLSKEQYDAVAGKSLGAKNQMIGMYSTSWLNEQAQKRSLALEQGKGAVEVDVAHQKLLDTINVVKSGYGTAVGVKPGSLPITPNRQQNPPRAVPRAQLVSTQPDLGSGSPVPVAMGFSGQAPAAATQIKIGNAFGPKEVIPPGGKAGTVGGKHGLLYPDNTFRPF